MFKYLIVFVCLLFSISTKAEAANAGTVNFSGLIASGCNVSTFVDGTIVANAGSTTLSSSSGGTPASFTASSNAGLYKITFGTPVLTGPSGTVSGATITVTSSSTGTSLLGAAISLFNSVGSVLNLTLGGTYAVTVNATASLSSGSFAAGTYSLSVPVTCSL